MRILAVLLVVLTMGCAPYTVEVREYGVATYTPIDDGRIIRIDTTCYDKKPYETGKIGCIKKITYKEYKHLPR